MNVTIPRFQGQRPPAHDFCLVFLSFGGLDKGLSEACFLNGILPRILTVTNSSLIIIVAVVQSPSHVRHFPTPWTAACQASLSFTISWSLLKLMSIEFVMPSNHLILCRPLLLLPSIFPSIRGGGRDQKLHF